MKNIIRISKIAGNSYKPHQLKEYQVQKGETRVGYVGQDVTGAKWQVQDRFGVVLCSNSSIKTAARMARIIFNEEPVEAPLPASWVLIPCPSCDGEGFVEVEEPGGYYDMRQECWYPKPRAIPCPKCQGQCEVEATFEPHLLELGEAA